MDLEKILTDKLSYRIIKFFHQHQATVDSVEGISRWTGIPSDAIKDVLPELVKSKIIVPLDGDAVKGYGYTQEVSLVRQIEAQLVSERPDR